YDIHKFKRETGRFSLETKAYIGESYSVFSFRSYLDSASLKSQFPFTNMYLFYIIGYLNFTKKLITCLKEEFTE
ncbi:hypothetical protein L9F63_005416, partial [Diploptera punctata]